MYEVLIQLGIAVDPRGRAGVEKMLAAYQAAYNEMSDTEKKMFDVERLTNPFSDTRLICGEFGKDVHKIMTGIDVRGSELILASQLGDKGELDAVVNHHAALGRQFPNVFDVLICQAQMMADIGVPYDIAEKVMAQDASAWEERIRGMGKHFRLFSRKVSISEGMEMK